MDKGKKKWLEEIIDSNWIRSQREWAKRVFVFLILFIFLAFVFIETFCPRIYIYLCRVHFIWFTCQRVKYVLIYAFKFVIVLLKCWLMLFPFFPFRSLCCFCFVTICVLCVQYESFFSLFNSGYASILLELLHCFISCVLFFCLIFLWFFFVFCLNFKFFNYFHFSLCSFILIVKCVIFSSSSSI